MNTRSVTTLRPILILTCILASPASVQAGGVVGNGSAASCTDGALDTALAGGGLVTFDCGPDVVTIDISPAAGGSGTKTINQDASIDGAGRIVISGGGEVLVFSVTPGVTFSVENLTITGGNGGGSYGGGVSGRSAMLFITNTTFSGNTTGVGGYGGAIASRSGDLQASLTIVNSTFSDNTAPQGYGGGISSLGGTLVIRNSTFSGNSAYRGGGTFYENNKEPDAALYISNSTFSGNRADGDRGGGLLIFPAAVGPLVISSCTFVGNSAVLTGGGIQKGCSSLGCVDDRPSSVLTVVNSILAENVGGNCGMDNTATIGDGGHNVDDGTTCGFSAAKGSLTDTDPSLDPAGLRDNGGPTETIALQADSPAINAGDPTVCAAPPVDNLDQRGFIRPAMGQTTCSIGAYEYTEPGTSDCCQCPASCAAPVDGSCGECHVVFGATCRGEALCVLNTPASTPPPTARPSSTPTATKTPTPTSTPIRPTGTPTLGTSVCCQCTGFCAAPVNGTCGGCIAVPDASCSSESLCVPRNSTRPCMGDCSGDGTVTVDELVTMTSIALGSTAAAQCSVGLPIGTCAQRPSLACNTDGDCLLSGDSCLARTGRTAALTDAASSELQVSIAEVLTAVNSALYGCPTN